MRAAVTVAGLVLVSVLAAIGVSGLQLAFRYMPSMPGTLYEITLSAVLLYLYRAQLGTRFRLASTQLRASTILILSCAVSIIALAAAQQYWLPAKPHSLGDGTELSNWTAASTVTLALLTAPLMEEGLFRGLLLPRLRRHLTPTAAVVTSAAAFAVAHDQTSQLIHRFAAGVLLGAIALCTGRLWLAVAAHGAINLSSTLVGVATELRLPERMGLLYPLAWLVIAAVAGIVFSGTLRQTSWDSTQKPHRDVDLSGQWTPDPRR